MASSKRITPSEAQLALVRKELATLPLRIKANAKGDRDYVIADTDTLVVDGIEGRFSLCWSSLQPATDRSERASKRIDSDVAKLSPEAKRELAEKLLAELA